jgi:putative ABC transport system permease protein
MRPIVNEVGAAIVYAKYLACPRNFSPFFRGLTMDLVTAIRQLKRAPGTAIAAVVTLAVGIGATTAVFSFVAAVMSAASPAPDMDRLAGLWSHHRSEAETKGLVTPADFLDWSARAKSFEAMAARRTTSFNVSGAGSSVRTPAQLVSPAYFRVFGWHTLLGRGFTDEDARPGATRVVVVSHPFWRNMLGGRADIIGQTIRLDGEPAIVVGVLPRIPSVESLFLPLSLDDQRDDRSARTLFVSARMRPTATLERARAELEDVGRSLEREFPATNSGRGVNVRPLQEEFVGPQARLVFTMLSGMVFVVLIIGCVNIANLLLARGIARQGELGLRLALGAGEWRVVRLLLVECAVLALLGGALSFAVSRWTLHVLLSLGTVDSEWIANGGMNLRVLGVTVVMSLFSTIAAGLAPALAARRAGLISALQVSARTSISGRRRATQTLVGAQVALAVALLVVGGLATRTLMALERLEAGFDIDDVLTASVTLPEAIPLERASQWIDLALARARQLPGVVSAGATSRLPFAGGRWNPNRGLEIDGQPNQPDESRFAVDYVITPELLDSLRIPLREGRGFTAADRTGTPLVVVVSETMARRFWPDRSPLGARLRRGDDPPGEWRTVVGVVGDVRNDDADQAPLPYLYIPFAQQPRRTMTLALRTASDPAAFATALRGAIASFDADQPLYDVRTMRDVWRADLEGTRTLIRVMGALALVALGLAGLGVWGVAAHAVSQRTREIGVRVAVGASARRVGAMMAWQGLLPVAIGLAVGLAAGLGLGQVMRGILFRVTPTDPATVIATLIALAAVAVAATLGPALRAARLDPVVALRVD